MNSPVLKAAMGKVVITPEELSPLQGYDPAVNIADPATDVLDDLFAKVLILDDGSKRAVIVCVDCCLTNENTGQVADPSGKGGSNREFLPTFPAGTRARWAKAARVDADCISVQATHTHTAPAQFLDKYIRRIEETIEALNDQLVPVVLSVGEGQSGVSAYRRPTLHADLSVPINQSMRVLVIETADERKPLGCLVNYAVHPTATRNPTSRISGDIVGLAAAEVEKAMGDDSFVAMFIQGFSGDVCPLYGDNGPKEDTYPRVVEGSRVLAGDMMKAMERRSDVAVGPLRTAEVTVPFPTREGFYIPTMDVRLFGLAAGDAALLTVSGEVFNGYIEKIEALSPFAHTLLSGVANGYSGYLPTYEAFHDGKGGYEMNTTPYTDETESILLRESGELLAKLHGVE